MSTNWIHFDVLDLFLVYKLRENLLCCPLQIIPNVFDSINIWALTGPIPNLLQIFFWSISFVYLNLCPYFDGWWNIFVSSAVSETYLWFNPCWLEPAEEKRYALQRTALCCHHHALPWKISCTIFLLQRNRFYHMALANVRVKILCLCCCFMNNYIKSLHFNQGV